MASSIAWQKRFTAHGCIRTSSRGDLHPIKIYSHTKNLFPYVIIFKCVCSLHFNLLLNPQPHTHTNTDSVQEQRPSSPLQDYLLPVGMYLYGLAWWIIKPLLLPWLGVGHLFMTPVMAVIVTVEITCQEEPCGKLGEGVPLLTRGDRGTGKRTEGVERLGSGGLGGRPGRPDDFSADNQPPWPVG